MTSEPATCPSGTRLLGGGAQSTQASNESVKVIGSYPSDSSGNAAADGATNPTSWTAVSLNGSQSGTGNTTTAYAVCRKLVLGPLVAAVTDAAAARGVDPAALFDGVAVSKAWATAARGGAGAGAGG